MPWKGTEVPLRRGIVFPHESPLLAGAGSLSSYNQRDLPFPGSFSWLFRDSLRRFSISSRHLHLSLDGFCECLNTNLSLIRHFSYIQENPSHDSVKLSLRHLCRFPSFPGEISSSVFCIHRLYSHFPFLFIQANMISALTKTIN